MTEPPSHLEPSRERFAADPFGYSALAAHRWTFLLEIAGVRRAPENVHSSHELKSPVLWLTHAHALSEAAAALFRSHPSWEAMPKPVRGICDGQYCAAGLMLVGYSLEVCLKAMMLVQLGVKEYAAVERTYRHHNLVKLSEFVPNLTKKDKSILEILTHFVEWAGRYPDPGGGRETKADQIFVVSEKHKIAAKDVFDLAARVMGHTVHVVDAE